MGSIYSNMDKENNSKEGKMSEDTISNLMSIGGFVCERDDVIFRNDEINRMYDIMNRSIYRTVLLVGDKGCGKRSIIEGFIQKSIDMGNEFKVLNIDFQKVASKVGSGASFEKIMGDIITTCADSGDIVPSPILSINNFGHILNMNCYGNAGFAFYNNLLMALDHYNIRIIATCTNDESTALIIKILAKDGTRLSVMLFSSPQSAKQVTNSAKYTRYSFGTTETFVSEAFSFIFSPSFCNLIYPNQCKYCRSRQACDFSRNVSRSGESQFYVMSSYLKRKAHKGHVYLIYFCFSCFT